jgi:hypothetical protein
MKSLVQVVAAVVAIAATVLADEADNTGVTVIIVPTSASHSASRQTGCPTVTATRELCTTCPVPACLGLATVTQSCGCPVPIPTVYLDFPCSNGCSGIWCSTTYFIETATGTCGSASASTTPSSSASSASSSGPSGSGPGEGGGGTTTFSSTVTTTSNGTVTPTTSSRPIVSSNAANGRLAPFWGW